MKYVSEASWPMIMNGCSTGWLPTQVRMRMFATRAQNRICDRGRKVIDRSFDVCSRGMRNRTRIEAARASTPPSLFGMDRRMAYANRKYHSGLMWGGVTSGLAGVKFSGSPRRFGANRASETSRESISANPKMSLIV